MMKRLPSDPRALYPRFRSQAALAGTAFAGAVLMLAATCQQAKATVEIQYRIGGIGSYTTLPTTSNYVGALGSFFTTTGISAGSNTPGSPNLADVVSSTLSISNITGDTHSIEFLIGDTGFSQPVAPPNATFQNNISGTVVTGSASNAVSQVSCIDTTNVQNACPGTVSTPLATTAIASPTFSVETSAVLTSLTAPYSMTEDLVLTLGGGATVNLSTSSTLKPVPEPGSLALLGTGLLGLLGLGLTRRSGSARPRLSGTA